MKTNECEKDIRCDNVTHKGHTYKRDSQINKCVSQTDGSVYTHQSNNVTYN